MLKGVGALLAAPPVAGAAIRRTNAAEDAFAWGVASFDPTDDGVLLWTRVGGAPPRRRLRWEVAEDESMERVVARGTVEATAEADHCATVAVDGLAPQGIWWYRFETEDGKRSPVGRTRTLPRGPVDRVRLGVASCSRFAAGAFGAYRALAERELDLVVHLGDYIYEDGTAGARPHDPPAPLRSLDDYRRRYAQHRLDPDLQALHARHPMVAVWDDHELAGNAWRDGAAAHDDARDGPWADRLAAATQAHEEWVPGRTHLGHDGRLEAWRSVALGDLAELVALDTRSHRDRQAASAEELRAERAAADDGGPGRTLLGPDQARWVDDRLRRADRPPWVLLANQVMLHPLQVPVPTDSIAAQVQAVGFLVVDGVGVNPDQWDGYPAARNELLDAIGDGGGVVVLTGDVHSSWAWEGPAGADRSSAMVELVTPSITSTSLGDRLPVSPQLLETALRGLDPALSLVELTRHGYLVVDLGPDELQAEWWYVDDLADAGSQRFGAALRAPRRPPMALTSAPAPLPDPAATTTSTTGPPSAPSGSSGAGPPANDDGDGSPLPLVGGAAVGVAAVIGAAVALRRRR